MEILQEVNDGVTQLRLNGRLDAQHSAKLKMALQDESHRWITVDLADTTFIDSMGLATLVSTLKTARQRGGDLILMRPSTSVKTIFDLTAMDKVFRFAPNIFVATQMIDAVRHQKT
jgi:anti-sigma B factor antagonist